VYRPTPLPLEIGEGPAGKGIPLPECVWGGVRAEVPPLPALRRIQPRIEGEPLLLVHLVAALGDRGIEDDVPALAGDDARDGDEG
jgi:hypothetical protein